MLLVVLWRRTSIYPATIIQDRRNRISYAKNRFKKRISDEKNIDSSSNNHSRSENRISYAKQRNKIGLLVKKRRCILVDSCPSRRKVSRYQQRSGLVALIPNRSSAFPLLLVADLSDQENFLWQNTKNRRGGGRDLVESRSPHHFSSFPPSPAALPNRLSSQYRRVFMSTPKRSKSIETSDFGVKVSILAIRSDWFWFRHEIALKKPTSNQSGESFELVLISLWNCSEKSQLLTKTVNQNHANGVTRRWGNHTIGESPFGSAFLFFSCLS